MKIEKKLKNCIDEIISLKATNKSPLYNNMLYWSQKPFNICSCLIKYLSKEGDVIFDPFLGSGVTVIESLNKCYKRKAIGVDINDLPIFLCKSSLISVSENERYEIAKYKEKVEYLNKLYETTIENEKYVIKKTYFNLQPKLEITSIECINRNNKVINKQIADDTDYKKMQKTNHVNYIDNIDLIEDSRVAVKSGEKISDKFTPRNFYILGEIKGLVENEKNSTVKQALLFIYTSIIHKSKILDYKMGSQWALWIPKVNCLERNVVLLFIEAIDKYLKSLDHIKDNYNTDCFVSKFSKLDISKGLIIKKPIQHVSCDDIPDDCVDLVITDPPYLSQVPYSEYMQLYKGFLTNDIDFENEIVITNNHLLKKSYDNYINDLKLSFEVVSRKLKNDAYMCMYFHDSSLQFWNDLFEIMNTSGLHFITAVHIDKKQKTLKKILDPKKTMNGESLLFFKKESIKNRKQNTYNDNYREELKKSAIAIFKKNKRVSTSEIFDNVLLSYLVHNNLLDSVSKQYKDFIDIIQEIFVWEESVGLWSIN